MRLWSLAAGLWSLILIGTAAAQPSGVLGLPIAEVRIVQEGRPVEERVILGLIETQVGEPLSMRDVRQSIDHLYGLNRFDDIQVGSEQSERGVVVIYTLVPRHAVQSVEFTGTLAQAAPPTSRAPCSRFTATAGTRRPR